MHNSRKNRLPEQQTLLPRKMSEENVVGFEVTVVTDYAAHPPV